MPRITLASLIALALLGASSTVLAQAAPGAAPGTPQSAPPPPPPPALSAGPGQPPPAPPPGGYGVPPGYYPPQGGYGAPQGGYPAPQGGYGAPQGGYGAPPGYYPPPGYGAPPGYYPYGSPTAGPPPTRLPYEEGETPPPGYSVATRPRKGLLIGGVATFAATYGLSFIVGLTAATSNSSVSSELGPLLIPVAGPFVTIRTADSSGSGTAILVLDGLAQAAGVGMIIGAFAAKEKYLQLNATASIVPEVFVAPRAMALRWQF